MKIINETDFLSPFFRIGAPQFLRNFKGKSTQGMSIMMVALWTVGDIFKTCYYKLRDAPTQFWACGLLQVSMQRLRQYKKQAVTFSPLVDRFSFSFHFAYRSV